MNFSDEALDAIKEQAQDGAYDEVPYSGSEVIIELLDHVRELRAATKDLIEKFVKQLAEMPDSDTFNRDAVIHEIARLEALLDD